MLTSDNHSLSLFPSSPTSFYLFLPLVALTQKFQMIPSLLHIHKYSHTSNWEISQWVSKCLQFCWHESSNYIPIFMLSILWNFPFPCDLNVHLHKGNELLEGKNVLNSLQPNSCKFLESTSTADESHSVSWKLLFHLLSSRSFCSSDVYRCESGRSRSLPFIIKYFLSNRKFTIRKMLKFHTLSNSYLISFSQYIQVILLKFASFYSVKKWMNAEEIWYHTTLVPKPDPIKFLSLGLH